MNKVFNDNLCLNQFYFLFTSMINKSNEFSFVEKAIEEFYYIVLYKKAKRQNLKDMSTSQQKQISNLQQWLQSINCIQYFTQNDILNGTLVHNIIRNVNPSSNSQLKQLSPSTSTLSRVTNWTILTEQLKTLSITLLPEHRSKIVAGDRDAVLQVVYKLKQLYLQKQKSLEVDWKEIDAKREVDRAKTLLEMVMILIVRNFKLSGKEAVGLLANQSKYLAHVLTKGLKGDFKPIQSFLIQLNKHQQLILHHCQSHQSNKQNLVFFLRSLKPALISKSQSVSLLCLEFFNKFLQFYSLKERMDIFETHLQSTYLLTIKRHPALEGKVVEAMFEEVVAGRRDKRGGEKVSQASAEQLLAYRQKLMKDVFSALQSESEKNTIMLAIVKVFGPRNKLQFMLSVPFFTKQIQNTINGIKQKQTSTMCIDIALLLCQYSPQLFSPDQQEDDDEQSKLSKLINPRQLSQKLLQNLQSLTTPPQPIPFAVQLFTLLQHFGRDKHFIAPNLYKLILERFSSVQSSQSNLYHIYLTNIISTIKQFPSIPWSPVLDNLLSRKRSEGEEEGWFDQVELEFLMFLLQQPNMELKNALFIFNYVSKAFIQSYHLAGFLTKIMLKIIDLYSRNQPIVQQLTLKLVKVCLAIHHANTKKLLQKRKSLTGNTKITDEEALMRIKNNSIEFFVFKLSQLHVQDINGKIEPLVAYNFIQMKDKLEFVKGFRKTLEEMGDFDEIIERYLVEFKRVEEEAKQIQKLEKMSKQRNKAKQKLSQPKIIIKNISISRYEQDSSNSTNKQDVTSSDTPTLGYKGQSFSMHVRPLNGSFLGVTPSAQKGIQKFQKVYLNRLQKQDLEKIRVKEQQEKFQLMKRVYKKKLVSHYGLDIKGSTDQIQYLFEFDTMDQRTLPNKVPYYTTDTEQDRDLMACQKLLKLYQKPLKVVFSNYSGQKKGQVLNNFDQMAEKKVAINSTNIYRLMKDFGFEDYISLKEVQQLCQKINIELNPLTTADYQLLDVDGFVEFFKQASFLMFTRPPKDLRGQPLTRMLQQTLSNFKLFAAENKISEQIFEEPSSLYFNETQAVAELNRKLAKNAEYILPEGYKKIVESRIVFQYGIVLQALSEQYKDVIQIVDEIIYKAIGVHIIEPFARQQKLTRARPALFVQQRLKISTMPPRHIPVSLKKEIMKLPIKSREQGKQCAIVIDEMISAIQLGHSEVGLRHLNKVQAERKKVLDEERRQLQIQRRRRQSRNRQAKSAIQQYKQQHKQKQQLQSLKKQQQQKKLRQQKQRKQRQAQQLKRKIEEYNNKKKQQQEQKSRKKKQQQQKQARERERLKQANEETKRKLQQEKKRRDEEEALKRAEREAEEKRLKEMERKRFNQSQLAKKKMVEEFRLRRSQLKTVAVGDLNNSSVGQEGKNLEGMAESKVIDESTPNNYSKKSSN